LCTIDLRSWRVSFDRAAISLLISHGLDISLDTLVHVIQLKLFLFIAIRHEAGLNEIIASELDTSLAATIL
jgi:hypothetical protein